MLQRFLVPNPAAGADWTWTVPGEYQATLVSVTAQLAASAQPVSSADQSGNAHTLTYAPAMYTHETFGVTGPFGAGGGLAVDCGNFDSLSGNDLGSAPNSGGVFDVATFTWEALVNCQNTGNVTQTLGCIFDGSLNHFRCGIAIDRGGGIIRAIASAADIPSLGAGAGTGVWQHVAATYDGAQWVGYLNGVGHAAVVGHAPSLGITGFPLFVMGDGTSSQGVNGKIAAFAYYSGALAAANILNHANAVATSAAAYQAAVLVDTPLAFWMLNDVQTHFQRTAILTVSDGTTTVAQFPGFAPSQQSNLFTWTWSVDGSGANQTPSQGVTIVPITPTVLPPGYKVGTRTLDLTTFDQWQNIAVWADVSPSGAGGPGGGPLPSGYLNALLVPDYSHQGA